MSWTANWSFSAGKRGSLIGRVSGLMPPSQIVDDSYLHALRVYRDTGSGAVRLQASVHNGEMKRYARLRFWLAGLMRVIQLPRLDRIYHPQRQLASVDAPRRLESGPLTRAASDGLYLC